MSDPAADPTSDVVPPVRPTESTGSYALFAAIGGLVFLYLSLPMITWFFGHDANPYNVTWQDGTPVPYPELTGGTMWRDIGTLGSGLLLLDEAVLYLLAGIRSQLRRPVLLAVAGTAVLGVALNALAAGMQIKAGFTAPLYAFIGGVVFILSATTALRLIRAK